jgi:hypothetical protein
MTDHDERKPGFYPAPPEAIPPYRTAIGRYQDPAKQTLIKDVEGGDDLEWDRWKATIEYGRRVDFEGILDFFVNLPSLQETFGDESATEQWYWHELDRVTLDTKFYYRPELVRLLRANAGADALIMEGWLVKYVDDRIDTETTWSDASYLFATNRYFAYIQLYNETIH